MSIIIQGLYKEEEDNSYNAFEKDIAVVHFFFQVTFESVNCKNRWLCWWWWWLVLNIQYSIFNDGGSAQYSIKMLRNRQCSNSDGLWEWPGSTSFHKWEVSQTKDRKKQLGGQRKNRVCLKVLWHCFQASWDFSLASALFLGLRLFIGDTFSWFLSYHLPFISHDGKVILVSGNV